MIRMDDITILGDGEKEDGYTNYKVRATKYFEHPLHYTDVDWLVRNELEDLLNRLGFGEEFEPGAPEELAEAVNIVLSYYKKIMFYED